MTNLGVWFTFYTHYSYFYIVGISIGCSHNIVEVDNIDFVKSNRTRKFFRGLLGSILMSLLYTLNQYFENNDKFNEISYLMKALYCILVPWFIMGPFTLICKELGLVKNDEIANYI